jgi:hypothetical protein
LAQTKELRLRQALRITGKWPWSRGHVGDKLRWLRLRRKMGLVKLSRAIRPSPALPYR